jgi:hypothetical protein
MSGMVLGSMMEADARIRAFEARIRAQKRLAKEQAYWESIRKELEDDGDE